MRNAHGKALLKNRFRKVKGFDPHYFHPRKIDGHPVLCLLKGSIFRTFIWFNTAFGDFKTGFALFFLLNMTFQ